MKLSLSSLKRALILTAALTFSTTASADAVFEKSITELQTALASGGITSRQLVEGYFARIQAYDQAGPRLNAIIALNAKALEEADTLDKERARKKVRGPLHGVPILVKDNYETVGMPTTAGTLALATYQSATDSYAVKRLKAAGAIIIGKATMHELAAGIMNIASLTGATRNPYAPNRAPGGSSGGTGSAIGASFAAAGMGSDTCGSIRIPAAFQNLMGMRGTRGLSSRDGIVPLSSTQDIGGPLTRSVTDLAIMLDATVGADINDPITAESKGHIPKSYRDALVPDALKGARIGVVRALFGTANEDRDYGRVIDEALKKMKDQGAEVVEISIPGLEDLLKDSSVMLLEFRADVDAFLARRPNAPVKTFVEMFDRGLVQEQLMSRRASWEKPDVEALRRGFIKRQAILEVVKAVLAENKLDALAYPTITRLPNVIGNPSNGGSNCQLSASTGLPALSVAVGFGTEGTPVGMELLGAPFAESTLLKIAYGWEQAASPRKAPFSTPALINGQAPRPTSTEINLAAADGTGATGTVTYDSLNGILRYESTAVKPEGILGLTLQRGTAEAPGGVIANLLIMGQAASVGEIQLRASEREDLAAGKLFVHLYTRAAPLGAGRIPLTFTVTMAQN